MVTKRSKQLVYFVVLTFPASTPPRAVPPARGVSVSQFFNNVRNVEGHISRLTMVISTMLYLNSSREKNMRHARA